MKGLTLTTREQNRLQTLNGVLERHWPMREAANAMPLDIRQQVVTMAKACFKYSFRVWRNRVTVEKNVRVIQLALTLGGSNVYII